MFEYAFIFSDAMLHELELLPQALLLGVGCNVVLLLEVGLELLGELPLLDVRANEVLGSCLERLARGKAQPVALEVHVDGATCGLVFCGGCGSCSGGCS